MSLESQVQWWTGQCLLKPMVELVVCNPADYDRVRELVEEATDKATEGQRGLDVMSAVGSELKVARDSHVPEGELKGYEQAANYYRSRGESDETKT